MSSEARAFVAVVLASLLAYGILIATLDVVCKTQPGTTTAQTGIAAALHRK
jgi:hypothetical protein